MAAVGGPSRQTRVSMSVSMSLVQGGTAAQQGAILAAAAPYYQPAVSQDVVPDRPIGYGAFGVVWYGSYLSIYFHCHRCCCLVLFN